MRNLSDIPFAALLNSSLFNHTLCTVIARRWSKCAILLQMQLVNCGVAIVSERLNIGAGCVGNYFMAKVVNLEQIG